ncbi:MAG TPA: 50S ribosomal protein L23 [Candidatus Kapabacteria bacterium]|nr:50S ribosomal protein L23 [Candidatus Kapabacteria bacterium]
MRQVLKSPILTEKSSLLADKGQYVFEVIPSANKIEIRKAVEERYNVGVTSVRTITVKPKQKVQLTRRGYVAGKTARGKKAIVSLKPGQKIDIVGELPTEE